MSTASSTPQCRLPVQSKVFKQLQEAGIFEKKQQEIPQSTLRDGVDDKEVGQTVAKSKEEIKNPWVLLIDLILESCMKAISHPNPEGQGTDARLKATNTKDAKL